jgi:hypothetical protein
MRELMYLCGGCAIPIVFGAIFFISEFSKFYMSWDGRYVGMSWLKIHRAQKAYRRNDFKTYRKIIEEN